MKSLYTLLPLILLFLIMSCGEDPVDPIQQAEIDFQKTTIAQKQVEQQLKINAENAGPQLSKDDDPRITKIGKVLRKTRLDEIPQFIDIPEIEDEKNTSQWIPYFQELIHQVLGIL